MQDYEIDLEKTGAIMVLDALLVIKGEQDETLAFRRSCGEGVCGSDGMNINGKNGLACITPIRSLSEPIVLKPFPGMPVIRDLIVDITQFYAQYEKAHPYLLNESPPPSKERLQSPEQRAKLDGLYECIMCGCCTSSCPSYWWNPDKFLGPAALLQACRFIVDSRDTQTRERLAQLDDAYSVFRCRSIMNCADVCPKGLNPTQAIATIRTKMLEDDV
jgi:succinate dehydrogenase / fumarate reductase iron-sulfur subunit